MSNFLSNIGSSGNSATFFELAMVEQGGISLWPAFEHVLRTLTVRSPTSNTLNLSYYMGREIFAVLRAIVEGYLLTQYNSTAFELLYGLRRAAAVHAEGEEVEGEASDVRQGRSGSRIRPPRRRPRPRKKNNPFQQEDPPPVLTQRLVLLSLFELTILPYVAAKMDRMHEAAAVKVEAERKQVDAASTTTTILRSRGRRLANYLRSCFVALYPYIRKSVGVALSSYQLVFALGRTQYFSPWQHFWSYNIVRQRPPESRSESGSGDHHGGEDLVTEMLNMPTTLQDKVSAWAVTGVQYGVVAGVLAFKFFEWWYTPEVQDIASKSSGGQKTAPPSELQLPQQSVEPQQNLKVPRDTGAVGCSLCKEQCTNMAASPSGFIYCYPCLYTYVQEHGRTPRGCLPCTVTQIRKCWVS